MKLIIAKLEKLIGEQITQVITTEVKSSTEQAVEVVSDVKRQLNN